MELASATVLPEVLVAAVSPEQAWLRIYRDLPAKFLRPGDVIVAPHGRSTVTGVRQLDDEVCLILWTDHCFGWTTTEFLDAEDTVRVEVKD